MIQQEIVSKSSSAEYELASMEENDNDEKGSKLLS